MIKSTVVIIITINNNYWCCFCQQDFGRTPERSYTNNFQSASSFETKKVKGESQENLTSDAPEERYTTTSKPFAEQRVEYATVGSSTFTKQSDV